MQKVSRIRNQAVAVVSSLAALFLLLCGSSRFGTLLLLAFLDHFGLGCRSRCLDSGLRRGWLLSAERHDMRNHCIRRTQQAHRARQRDIARPDILANHQFRDVDSELFGNFIRETFDFDFTRDDLMNAALHLHAFRIAVRDHRNFHSDALLRSILFRSTCSRASLMGSCCQSTIMTGVVSPLIAKLKIVLCPVLLFRMRAISFGLTATAWGAAVPP